MPFESKVQQRKLYALEAAGKLKKGTAAEFASHTDFKHLPEKKKKGKGGKPKDKPGTGYY